MQEVLDKLKSITGWAKSHHASSVVVGLAVGVYGVGLYFGLGREVLITIAAAIVLVLVPVANAIHD